MPTKHVTSIYPKQMGRQSAHYLAPTFPTTMACSVISKRQTLATVIQPYTAIYGTYTVHIRGTYGHIQNTCWSLNCTILKIQFRLVHKTRKKATKFVPACPSCPKSCPQHWYLHPLLWSSHAKALPYHSWPACEWSQHACVHVVAMQDWLVGSHNTAAVSMGNVDGAVSATAAAERPVSAVTGANQRTLTGTCL
jgi:hypothetical protein